MSMILRILLLVAGFAFGAKPMHGIAQAALSVQESGMAKTGDASVSHHHGAMVSPEGRTCPHETLPEVDHSGHKAMTGGHCSACLTLVPIILFADMGRAPGSDKAPGLALRLKSTPAVPLERPPRLRE